MMRQARDRHLARQFGGCLRLLVVVVALAAAVAGIPYALTATIGAPWPDQVASFDDLLRRLNQPVSDPFLLKVLALIGWAFWAYFMLTLFREALWLLRHLPALVRDTALLSRHAAALPVHRAAAALLIGTLLLALLGAGRPPTAQAATPAPEAAAPHRVTAGAPRHVEPAQATRPSYTTYTVKVGDTLWDIAEQHLGDPLLWPQIYQLSCTIRQADGRLLADPDVIIPGWQLHLPVLDSPAPTPPPAPDQPAAPPPSDQPVTPPPRTPAPLPTDAEHGTPGHHGHDKEEREADQHKQDHGRDAQHRPVTISLGAASAIGVTTAAGIAAALVYARRHAARGRTPTLDALAEPLADDDVQLSDALRRSNQAHLKARSSRHHDPAALPRRAAPAEPGLPGTVTIAEKAGKEVRIDALAVPGGVQLTGPGAANAARHLAVAIAGASERLRPAEPRAKLLVPRSTMEGLLPRSECTTPAWTVTSTIVEAIDMAEHTLLEHARHERRLDHATLGDGLPPLHVLLIDKGGPDSERIEALAGRATPGQLAVVMIGKSLGPARHQLTVDEDGTVTGITGTLSALHDATFFTLALSAANELLRAVSAAHGHSTITSNDRPEPDGPERTPQPRPASASEEPGSAPAPPKPSRKHGPETPKTAQPTGPEHMVQLSLLGSFKILIHGQERALTGMVKEETREFLALLAAHPDGLRGEEIVDKMQLPEDPDAAKSALENLRRSARRALRKATGKREVAFVVLHGPAHRLDAQYVSTDIERFTAALKDTAAADSAYGRAEALQRATSLYTGPLCEGADYLWLHGLRRDLHRRAVDALMLLAEHTAQHSADPEPALALLNRAADLDPENERVYRRVIQLQLALGRDDAAHRTLGLLAERLAAIDLEPEPATLALLHTATLSPRGAAGRHGTTVRR
ncbi:BTAD domain-containing putative transcriptional regulator [Streptomyces monticola]|uniref:BTAD domain-containing putative transcriptional regulator n=1 Tax=Streptomyces monticola TaxID=2666263 RepID=A0ABW2JHU8_9ACTN